MLNFCDFIQVFVFTTNHHLNYRTIVAVAIILNYAYDVTVSMVWMMLMINKKMEIATLCLFRLV